MPHRGRTGATVSGMRTIDRLGSINSSAGVLATTKGRTTRLRSRRCRTCQAHRCSGASLVISVVEAIPASTSPWHCYVSVAIRRRAVRLAPTLMIRSALATGMDHLSTTRLSRDALARAPRHGYHHAANCLTCVDGNRHVLGVKCGLGPILELSMKAPGQTT